MGAPSTLIEGYRLAVTSFYVNLGLTEPNNCAPLGALGEEGRLAFWKGKGEKGGAAAHLAA